MVKKNVTIVDKPSAECHRYFDGKISKKLSTGIFMTVMVVFLSLSVSISVFLVQNQRILERKMDILISVNPAAVKLMKDLRISKNIPSPSSRDKESNEMFDTNVAIILPKKVYE